MVPSFRKYCGNANGTAAGTTFEKYPLEYSTISTKPSFVFKSKQFRVPKTVSLGPYIDIGTTPCITGNGPFALTLGFKIR